MYVCMDTWQALGCSHLETLAISVRAETVQDHLTSSRKHLNSLFHTYVNQINHKIGQKHT
jgi:hypothetical protein